MSPAEAVHAAAREAYAVGLCIVPPAEDGTKRPLPDDTGRWDPFKTRRPTKTELQRWYPGRAGLGVITGEVSGRAECWDFDDRDTYEAFLEAAREAGLEDIVGRICAGYRDDTPGDGVRWLVRYPEGVEREPGGRIVLARRPGAGDEPKVVTLIELPAYNIVAPTNGRVHPSGRPYVRRSGEFATIASYTADERDALIELARSFDAMPKAEAHEPTRTTGSAGTRPGDIWATRTSWSDILGPHGWTAVFSRSETTYWRRPGKKIGISATTNHGGSDLLYCFSTSTEFEAEKSYTKFGAWALLEHRGDFPAAARALAGQGYGELTPRERTSSRLGDNSGSTGSNSQPKIPPHKGATSHAAPEPGEGPGPPLDEPRRPEPLFDVTTARFGRFLEADPPPRRSLVEDVLPIPIAALLGSIGGTGKSTLIYQLGMSVCAQAPFLGLPISEAGSALLLFSEDDEAELHRRGRILLDHYRESGRFIDVGALSERLHVVSRVACDNLLTRAGNDGEAIRTPIVDRLIATAERIPDLKLIGIDPASRFRGGNANSEEHVTRFVEAIEAIRDATGATVICAAHATKLSALTGDSEQGMVRGSSALVDGFRWVATAVRMSVQQAEAFGVDAGERRRYLRLEIPKSNYTAPFGGLWLERIPGGVLVPAELDLVPTTDRRRAKHDTEYRDILDRVKELIAEVGPLSRGAIRPYSGRTGRLSAGDKTVRAVIERAVSEGELIDNEGRIEIPETERKAA